jgi:type IV pilus assembly protein PilW
MAMTHPSPARPQQRGFSLPELMIAMAIGLIILAGMATLFVNNSKGQAEIEKSNRQVENGRFAIQLLGADLRNAGYLSEFDPTVLTSPTVLPDPCTMTLAALRTGLPLHVQGYDDVAVDVLSCITDVRAGTDVLVLRHTATCVVGATNCHTLAAGGPFFQASLCTDATELDSGDSANFYRLDTTVANLDRHKRNCSTAPPGTVADLRRYLTHIYFVANNDKASDGVPTLKRAELNADGSTLRMSTVAQVNGIEDMQFEYGVDTNGDGVSDLYSAYPNTANGCAADQCAVDNWRNVVAIKINLLARNLDVSKGHRDTKTYTLGRNADGTLNTTAAAEDEYKRHVFQSQVSLANPVGRKLP